MGKPLSVLSGMATFQEILESCEYKTRPYSGKAMYGKDCLGVSLTLDRSPFVMFAEALEVCMESDVIEVEKALRMARTDSLGLGMIVYFPGIEYADSGSDDSDEEDDY